MKSQLLTLLFAISLNSFASNEYFIACPGLEFIQKDKKHFVKTKEVVIQAGITTPIPNLYGHYTDLQELYSSPGVFKVQRNIYENAGGITANYLPWLDTESHQTFRCSYIAENFPTGPFSAVSFINQSIYIRLRKTHNCTPTNIKFIGQPENTKIGFDCVKTTDE